MFGFKNAAGQPRGLYVLFSTEVWERFSYYGMRALLVLYITKQLGYARADALALYSTYTALVYLTPLFGGYLADRFLGQRKAVLIGGCVMALGHFAMVYESMLFYALGLIAVGNGFFKPNVSTMVGGLYPEAGPRRDGGYTIFYMGINVGAFFAPLVCGTLGERVDWHVGFSVAGLGMMIGLAIFWWFQRLLGPQGYPPGPDQETRTGLTKTDWMHVFLWTAFSSLFVWLFLAIWPFIRSIWSPSFLTESGWLWGYRFALCGLLTLLTTDVARKVRRGSGQVGKEPLTGEQKQQIFVIVVVSMFAVLYGIGSEQAGGTMTLFADEKTIMPPLPDLPVPPELPLIGDTIRNWVISFNEQEFFPASGFMAVNPFWIVVLAPLFSMLWNALDRTRFRSAATTKQGIGIMILGLGFIVMYIADYRAGLYGKVGWQWLFTVYAIHTVAELCVWPVGLSLVSKLAPHRLASLMMAVWLLNAFASSLVAGRMEALLKSAEAELQISINLWAFLACLSIVSGAMLLLFTPFLKRMSHGKI